MIKKLIDKIKAKLNSYTDLVNVMPDKNALVEEITDNVYKMMIKNNFTLVTGSDVEVIDTNKIIRVRNDCTILVDKNIKIESKEGNITIIADEGNIIFKTTDGVRWYPNTLPNCLFTGSPHGGSTAGFTTIQGANV